MTKRYPVFDCDAHINDYLFEWQKYYSRSEAELVKSWFWNHGDTTIINGKAPMMGERPRSKWFVQPNSRRASIIDILGPGMNKEIIRKLYHMDLSLEQLEQVAHRGSIEPLPRIADMDQMGIDQVLVIPIGLLVGLQWIEHIEAAATVARAFNDWVLQDYCSAAPDRLFPAAVLAPQHAGMAAEELNRVAKLGFPVALVRPVDALGSYPIQAKFDPMWRAFEDTGIVCGMHTVTNGQVQQGQYSPGELLFRGVSSKQIGAGQTLSFIYEAMTWLTGVLLSGFLERYPRLKMAIFESNATWLPMLLESCDRAYHLYGGQRFASVQGLPSEIFHQRCLIAFESDEKWVYRRSRYYEDIGIWSSDSYHHDGTDAWEPIEMMDELEVPVEVQAKLMGGNARRFYGLEEEAKLFSTEPPASISRPDWFPTEEEIEREFAPLTTRGL